jgi:hypothetical protein
MRLKSGPRRAPAAAESACFQAFDDDRLTRSHPLTREESPKIAHVWNEPAATAIAAPPRITVSVYFVDGCPDCFTVIVTVFRPDTSVDDAQGVPEATVSVSTLIVAADGADGARVIVSLAAGTVTLYVS